MAVKSEADDLITLTCDECGEELDDPHERDDFSAMVATARSLGWAINQPQGAWRHECPDCAQDSNFERQMSLFP